MRIEKNLPSEKRLLSDNDSEMVTIISIRLKSRSLYRKEIYSDFKRKPETPRKWRQIKMKIAPLELVWSKTLNREIIVPLLEQ